MNVQIVWKHSKVQILSMYTQVGRKNTNLALRSLEKVAFLCFNRIADQKGLLVFADEQTEISCVFKFSSYLEVYTKWLIIVNVYNLQHKHKLFVKGVHGNF